MSCNPKKIVDSPGFLDHSLAKNIAVCAQTNRGPNKQEIRFIFVAQNFEVFSNIQNENLNIKNL
jgi:hypothetical protein